MIRGGLRGALLSLETGGRDEAASGRVGVRHPHAECLRPVCERRGEGVAGVGELERRHLPIGETGVGRGVGRIRIDVAGAALRRPRVTSALALRNVEDLATRHVVVDDAVGEAVERVALAHELAANGVDLRRGDPVGERLLLDANQLGSEHQRREADDRHVCGDAVVIGRVTLRDGERFAASCDEPM